MSKHFKSFWSYLRKVKWAQNDFTSRQQSKFIAKKFHLSGAATNPWLFDFNQTLTKSKAR